MSKTAISIVNLNCGRLALRSVCICALNCALNNWTQVYIKFQNL